MFNTEDSKCLDSKYFNIIAVDDYDVTIMSRNTGHYWYLHNPEYPEEGTVIIFHKHEEIKSRDNWQMGERKKENVTKCEENKLSIDD